MPLSRKPVLIAVTTANQLAYTAKALASLRAAQLRVPHEVVLFDDASEDETVNYVRQLGYRVITKAEPKGLTDSWNRAYHFFKAGDYSALLLTNNDVLFPNGAVEAMVKALRHYPIVGPMSTCRGVGHQPLQAVDKHYRLAVDESDPKNLQRVQQKVDECPWVNETAEVPYVNGFCFALAHEVVWYERADGNLFDPALTNVGNEDELQHRLPLKKAIALKSFVYHFKGASFASYRWGSRLLLDRNLKWNAAAQTAARGKRVMLSKFLMGFLSRQLARFNSLTETKT